MMSNHFTLASWPGIAVRRTASLPLAYARPSTSWPQMKEDVDARDKPGHDGQGVRVELEWWS
jgi:hypothetical protein